VLTSSELENKYTIKGGFILKKQLS